MICLVIAAILAVLTDGLNSSRVAFATKPSFRVRLWNLIVQGWQTNEMAKMPKTNGMIERFNDCIADVLATTRFGSSAHLADTIKRYVQVYNHHIPQKALGHIPPPSRHENLVPKTTQSVQEMCL